MLSGSSFGKIEEAQNGQLAFLANPKYEEYLYTTKLLSLLSMKRRRLRTSYYATLIRVPDAYSAFATFLAKYQEMINAATNWYSATCLYC